MNEVITHNLGVSNFRLMHIDRPLLTLLSTGTPMFFLYWCFTEFSWMGLLAIYLVASLLTMVRSIFGHRIWAHKGAELHPRLESIGLFLFTLGCIGSSIGFTGLHRAHHRYSDTAKDPHSPTHVSILKILFYIPYAKYEIKYAIDLIRSKKHVWYLKHYWTINFLFWWLLYWIDPTFLTIWIAGVGVNIFKANMVNVIGHTIGKVKPRNAMISSYIFLDGEFLHGNHHDDPANWNFSKKWYQIDLSALVLRIFSGLGWATLK